MPALMTYMPHRMAPISCAIHQASMCIAGMRQGRRLCAEALSERSVLQRLAVSAEAVLCINEYFLQHADASMLVLCLLPSILRCLLLGVSY